MHLSLQFRVSLPVTAFRPTTLSLADGSFHPAPRLDRLDLAISVIRTLSFEYSAALAYCCEREETSQLCAMRKVDSPFLTLLDRVLVNQGNEALDYSVANREKPYFILGRYA
ncbi:hypothetical protein NDU88_002964 [Pleurodeles waltl]|uniref:Uncharacterized protein n=1 Tax=Pleurodeles waltl TaxID=8319 RepID=A0AAV7PFK0_PLEWA|nr:hypothetical protein NDU88_002964 [Pleurodeles waltl]